MDRAALVRIAPFALSIALLALGDLWPRTGGPSSESAQIAAQWWYSLKTVLTALLLAFFWREYRELRSDACRVPPDAESPRLGGTHADGPRLEGTDADGPRLEGTDAASPRLGEPPQPPAPAARCWIEAVAVGLAVWLMWIWIGPLLRISPVEVPAGAPWPDAPFAASLWLALRFAGAVVVIPLVEELFWRSYLMRRIDSASFLQLPPSQVSWFAVLLSSAVFAMAHRELLAAFVCGVVYAGLYRRHGQLRYVVTAHAVTNLALGIYVIQSQRWEFW